MRYEMKNEYEKLALIVLLGQTSSQEEIKVVLGQLNASLFQIGQLAEKHRDELVNAIRQQHFDNQFNYVPEMGKFFSKQDVSKIMPFGKGNATNIIANKPLPEVTNARINGNHVDLSEQSSSAKTPVPTSKPSVNSKPVSASVRRSVSLSATSSKVLTVRPDEAKKHPKVTPHNNSSLSANRKVADKTTVANLTTTASLLPSGHSKSSLQFKTSSESGKSSIVASAKASILGAATKSASFTKPAIAAKPGEKAKKSVLNNNWVIGNHVEASRKSSTTTTKLPVLLNKPTVANKPFSAPVPTSASSSASTATTSQALFVKPEVAKKNPPVTHNVPSLSKKTANTSSTGSLSSSGNSKSSLSSKKSVDSSKPTTSAAVKTAPVTTKPAISAKPDEKAKKTTITSKTSSIENTESRNLTKKDKTATFYSTKSVESATGAGSSTVDHTRAKCYAVKKTHSNLRVNQDEAINGKQNTNFDQQVSGLEAVKIQDSSIAQLQGNNEVENVQHQQQPQFHN